MKLLIRYIDVESIYRYFRYIKAALLHRHMRVICLPLKISINLLVLRCTFINLITLLRLSVSQTAYIVIVAVVSWRNCDAREIWLIAI